MTVKQITVAAVPEPKEGQVWEAYWGDTVGRGTIEKVRARDVYRHWHRLGGKKVNSTTWSVPKSKLIKLIKDVQVSNTKVSVAAAAPSLLQLMRGLRFSSVKGNGKTVVTTTTPSRDVANRLVEHYKKQGTYKTITVDADGYQINTREEKIRVSEDNGVITVVQL